MVLKSRESRKSKNVSVVSDQKPTRSAAIIETITEENEDEASEGEKADGSYNRGNSDAVEL